MDSPRLVLASASPRRRELLDRLVLDFGVEPADVDESVRAGESAPDYVARLACEKANAVAGPNVVIIGADTTVVLDGRILGKPRDELDARAMLRDLRGRAHDVVTGVAVVVVDRHGTARSAVGTETSRVYLESLVDARLDWYVGTAEPYDKAGAYALQGAAAVFADRVEGSVSNVIGLPLPLLDRLLGSLDIDLLGFGSVES